jgi:hypothetical protein
MDIAGGLLFAISSTAIMIAAVLAIFKSRRRGAKRLAFASIAGMIVGITLIAVGTGEDVTSAGFKSRSDMTAAKQEGIERGEEWYAFAAAREAEEAEAAATLLRDEEEAREAAAAAAEAARIEEEAVAAAAALAEAEAARAEAETCRSDSVCWGRENRINAEVRCKRHIERLARFDHEWTNNWLEPMFSRSSWKNQEEGVLIYYGDRLRMQNAFGAWANVIYSCEYDPARDAAIEVKTEQGRL